MRAASQQPHVPVIHPRPSSESESARPRPSSPPPLRCVLCARSCGAARVPPHGRGRASVATRPRAARRRRRPAQELYRGELHGVHRAQPQVPVPRAPGRRGALSLRDRRVWCVAAFVRRVHDPRRATLRRRPERQSSPCVASRIRRAACDSLLLFRISGGGGGQGPEKCEPHKASPPLASDGRFGPSPTPPIKPTRLSTPHQHYSLTSTRAARHDHRRQATGTWRSAFSPTPRWTTSPRRCVIVARPIVVGRASASPRSPSAPAAGPETPAPTGGARPWRVARVLPSL